MRRRTAGVLASVLVVLGALVVFGLVASSGGTLEEAWVSDTPRDNQVNHHAVGVGPDGDVVVAPVAEVPYSDVSITNTSCVLARLAPGNGSVLWRDGIPAEHCFTHALTEPAVADVDGDGNLEVAVSTTEDALVVSDARTGREEYRVPLVTYGYGRPTVADVRPAPGTELVTSDIGGNVVVVDADGSVAWRVALNETVDGNLVAWDAPAVADVDADGDPEVVVGTTGGFAVLSPEGAVERTRRVGAAHVAVGQADDDPAREVFTAYTGTVRAFDGATGDLAWTRELGGTTKLRVAADADGDGPAELLVGGDGEVLALDARTGETAWTTTVATDEDTTLPAPVLGDVNGDGSPEVIAVTNAGSVVVLDASSGSELARYERDVPVWTFATLADIDDDGQAEVLVRYGDGRVVALEYTAS
jgi:outer membrane protein assembly factor BamB